MGLGGGTVWRKMGECDTKETKGRESFEKGVRSSYVQSFCWVNLGKIFKCPLFLAT